MNAIAIIGGSGCYGLPNLCPHPVAPIQTPYGLVSGILTSLDTADLTHTQTAVYFLPRHGLSHSIAPHKINYRANIWALNSLGVRKILAVNAVGSMLAPPGTWLIPRQIIDYTYGREHTFFDDFSRGVNHIDFTEPLNLKLVNTLAELLATTSLSVIDEGTYGCTQGPRLETAAEIQRLERDGCTMVGMTLMPEAALAAELSIAYASVCLSVNWAAGKCSEAITFEAIKKCLETEQARLAVYWPEIIGVLTKVAL